MTDDVAPGPTRSGAGKQARAHDAGGRIAAGISRIVAREPDVRAFRDMRLDEARELAERLDEIDPGDRGPLHGLSVGIKEVFDVAGLRCTWGTPIHAQRIPDADCTLASRLIAAGAIIMGTTTSTEYAMAREPETTNPFDPAKTPGASSSGSAAAVGAGMVCCALGSQSIGSGIRPAAYCGIIGFKPSHGVLPLDGAMPLSEALDHPVIMARGHDVLERVYRTLLGVPQNVLSPSPSPAPSRIMMVEPWYDEPLDRSVIQALAGAAQACRQLGWTVESGAITDLSRGERECVHTLIAHDMARHHGGDYDKFGHLMSPAMAGWIEMGRKIDAATYRSALDKRLAIIEALAGWLPRGAVILTAATVGPAPARTQGTGSRAPQRLWTLAGFPALTIPGWRCGALPIGVQLVAHHGADQLLLSVGRALANAVAVQEQPAAD